METTKNGLVRNYYDACTKIAEKFWNKYFANEYNRDFNEAVENGYFYAIGREPNGIWEIEAYMWLNIDDMAMALEYRATKEQLKEWYWATFGELEEEKRRHYNLKNFIKYGWISPGPKK